MDAHKLIKMANQIADYFDAYPEEEAVSGINNHITSFWEPRMIDDIKAIAGSDGGSDLHPLANKAVMQMVA